jgi:hypothetical protein
MVTESDVRRGGVAIYGLVIHIFCGNVTQISSKYPQSACTPHTVGPCFILLSISFLPPFLPFVRPEGCHLP